MPNKTTMMEIKDGIPYHYDASAAEKTGKKIIQRDGYKVIIR